MFVLNKAFWFTKYDKSANVIEHLIIIKSFEPINSYCKYLWLSIAHFLTFKS